MAKYKCTSIEGDIFYTDDQILASVCHMRGGRVEEGNFEEHEEPMTIPLKISKKKR